MSAEVRLRQGYRPIRQVAGDGDSPWAGSLVAMPNGDTAVAVDVAELGETWGGWDAGASGHVLGPIDILRRPDGHDVLLPVCTERLSDFLARRRRRGSELDDGEAVTVAVSVLRGMGELASLDENVRGSWWLTDDGRPVLATGSGGETVRAHTADLLAQLARDVPVTDAALRDTLDEHGALGALGAHGDPRRRRRELDRAEARLFEIAEPLALATTSFGPQRARERLTIETEHTAHADRPRGSWALSLARHVDADWADLVSRTTTGVWRAVRSRRPAGRRPWVLAGGLAVALVIGGLVWPTGGEGPATADVVGTESTSVPSPAPAPAPAPSPAPSPDPAPVEQSVESVESVDLAVVTAALLQARTACGEDADCLAGVLESADARFPAGVVDLSASERRVILLDEFGGAAVLRADAVADGAVAKPQLIVIVRRDGGWLLRDVHDVAEQ